MINLSVYFIDKNVYEEQTMDTNYAIALAKKYAEEGVLISVEKSDQYVFYPKTSIIKIVIGGLSATDFHYREPELALVYQVN